jgi:hypothetical protein
MLRGIVPEPMFCRALLIPRYAKLDLLYLGIPPEITQNFVGQV